eukprot:SAG11_NODE_2482_length_3305_cov_1.521210_5_plen_253_part_00
MCARAVHVVDCLAVSSTRNGWHGRARATSVHSSASAGRSGSVYVPAFAMAARSIRAAGVKVRNLRSAAHAQDSPARCRWVKSLGLQADGNRRLELAGVNRADAGRLGRLSLDACVCGAPMHELRTGAVPKNVVARRRHPEDQLRPIEKPFDHGEGPGSLGARRASGVVLREDSSTVVAKLLGEVLLRKLRAEQKHTAALRWRFELVAKDIGVSLHSCPFSHRSAKTHETGTPTHFIVATQYVCSTNYHTGTK